MKNDIKIKRKVEEIQGLMNEWALEVDSSYSDRILEQIVERSKELKDLHETRFDIPDMDDLIKIV